MKQDRIKILLSCGLLIGGMLIGYKEAIAQAPGSVTTYGGSGGSSALSIASGGTTADASETIYIGPGDYTIDGTWEVYSKNIWISPDAVITGTGSLVLYNPSVAGGAASPTLIDGNGSTNAIGVNIQLQNASGMQLTQIAADAALTGAGWVDNTASSSLYTGNDLDLAVNGAHVVLGTGVTGDLVLDADATISNYSANRMVVTNNSTLSHIIKQNLSASFVFPVGIAAGNYTPATVSPVAVEDIFVSVTDYSGTSATIEAPEEGMDRAWHIYGSIGNNADLTLQHSNTTDGTAYGDAIAFISQYIGGNQWSTAATSDFVSAGVHSHSGLTLPATGTDAGSWFTKTSDPVTPLPVQLLVFNAYTNGCAIALYWETGVENNFSHFELMRSTDGVNYTTIGRVEARGDNSSYDYTDADPAQGRNSYRLKIVDRDGTITYSHIETVFMDCAATVTLYPNPTYGMVTIEGLKGDEQVRVIDALGRVMKEATATSTIMHLDLSSLADAAYNILLIKGNTIQQSFKVIKRD